MSEERLDFLGLEGNGAVRSMLFKLGQNTPQLEQIVFSDHVTKINRRDKEQIRVLLITTRAVYNLLPNNYSKCKRRIPITLLSSITVSQLSDEFVLHIPDEYDYRFKSGKRDKIAEVINRMYKRTRDEEAAGKPQQPSSPEAKEPASPSGRKAKAKLHVQYVNDADLSSITLTKQQARMQSREDILRRKQELIVEVGDNDSDAENDTADGTAGGDVSGLHEQKTMEVEQLLNNTDKVRLEDFELLKVLGRGSFGKVMLVRYKRDGKKYAMKILKKKAIIARNQVEHTKAERKILESLQHPFLMTLRFAFQSTEKLYFVLDYYQGGELFFHLKNQRRFPETIARLFVAEIALALGHLHSLGVVYRDLKPENILLDDLGHVCLTDFGLSKDLDYSDKSHTFCGTPEYLAPEIVAGLGHNQGGGLVESGHTAVRADSGHTAVLLDQRERDVQQDPTRRAALPSFPLRRLQERHHRSAQSRPYQATRSQRTRRGGHQGHAILQQDAVGHSHAQRDRVAVPTALPQLRGGGQLRHHFHQRAGRRQCRGCERAGRQSTQQEWNQREWRGGGHVPRLLVRAGQGGGYAQQVGPA